MTMGAPRKGGTRNTSMSSRAARHGPPILRHLGGGTASSTPAAEPVCPPLMRQAVRDAVLAAAESARPPAFAAPSLDAIGDDPACRRLDETIQSALKKARTGLRAGRPEAELQREIRDLVMDGVQNLVVGDALEGMWLGLFGGDQYEEEMYLGAVTAPVGWQLAAEVLVDAAAESGEGRTPAELVRAALLSAEPTLYLIVKIITALVDAAAEYVRGLKAAEADDPKVMLTNATAQALERIGTPAVLRGPIHQADSKSRARLVRMADRICREIVRQLADPQTKISGENAEEESEA